MLWSDIESGNNTLIYVIVYDNIAVGYILYSDWKCIMECQVEFYKKVNGDIPVLDHLSSLDAKMRAKAFSQIELLKRHGFQLREPYVKPIKGARYKGIFELTVRFASSISRIMYFAYQGKTFVLLHGFTKKTKRTPRRGACPISRGI